MHNHRSRFALAVLVAGVAAALAGCGGGSHQAPSPPAARLVHSHGGSNIVLTPLGAQRIGLETARAAKAHRSAVTIPLGAVIYDPSGKTYAFVASGRLTYREVRVRVGRIDGNVAYLLDGPHPGTRVVSTGAEELYGVQTGVLGQT